MYLKCVMYSGNVQTYEMLPCGGKSEYIIGIEIQFVCHGLTLVVN